MFDIQPTQPIPGTEILIPSGAFRVTLHLCADCFRWVRNDGEIVSPSFDTQAEAYQFARANALVPEGAQ